MSLYFNKHTVSVALVAVAAVAVLTNSPGFFIISLIGAVVVEVDG